MTNHPIGHALTKLGAGHLRPSTTVYAAAVGH